MSEDHLTRTRREATAPNIPHQRPIPAVVASQADDQDQELAPKRSHHKKKPVEATEAIETE